MTPDKYAALIQDALDKMMALVSAQADPPLDRGDCAMMLEAALGVVVPAIREDCAKVAEKYAQDAAQIRDCFREAPYFEGATTISHDITRAIRSAGEPR